MRTVSIALVQGAGMIATLSFVFLLPGPDFVLITLATALAGLTSGFVVSNNTVKLYASISEKHGRRHLIDLTLRLLLFEQIAAFMVTCIVVSIARTWISDLNTAEAFLLALGASYGAIIAFVKSDDRLFILYNVIRFLSTMMRMVLVHLAAYFGFSEMIPAIIIVTFIAPFTYGGIILFLYRKATAPVADASLPSVLITLREYAYGLPTALSRAFFAQGIILVAVETLSTQQLRMFRFLMLPRDVIGTVFNAILPITFDRLYAYNLKLLPSLAVALMGSAVALGWYFVADLAFGFGWSAAVSYILFIILNLTVYSVLPIVWRMVYKNKVARATLVVLVATAVAAIMFSILPPQSINAIFIVMSGYTLTYLVGVLLMSRSESQGEKAG